MPDAPRSYSFHSAGRYRRVMTDDDGLTRRGSLVRLGGIAAAALGGAAWRAASGTAAAGSGACAVSAGAVACLLTPELTEDPHYVPVRRSGTTSRGGSPGRRSCSL